MEPAVRKQSPGRVGLAVAAGGVGLASSALAVGRSLWLLSVGTLPDAWFGEAVLTMAALALACGAGGVAALLALAALARRAVSVPVAALVGIAGTVLPFALLHLRTPLRAPLAQGASLPLQDALEWGPAIAFLLALGWGATRRAAVGTALRRLAALSAACAVAGAVVAIAIALRGAAVRPALPLAPTAERHPPVLVVLVDTLRADHLSAYGYERPTSPNVDALAADGVLFERAFSPASWTRPSCAALFTSLYPRELGVERTWDALPADVPMLPELMAAEGYATAGIISSVQLNPQYGFGRGFQTMDLGTSWLRWAGLQRPFERLRMVRRTDNYPRYNAQELTDRAIAWIDAHAGGDAPLFLYLHYADPHSPYAPPPDQDRWREFAGEAGRRVEAPPVSGPRPGQRLTAAERDALRARYDAEIAFFDHHFGRLLAHLEARGLYDGALIVLTSDHGEELGEHGGFGHAHSLENELLHVPLVMKLPGGARRGERPGRMAGLLDVVPTLSEALGARWPVDRMRGRSLLAPPDGDALVYARNAEPPLRAIHQGGYKLLQVLDGGEVVAERAYRLGDAPARPGAGVAPVDPPAEVDVLRRRLVALDAVQRDAQRIRVDDETRKELVALGYLE